MHHSRIEPASELHAEWCGCRDCVQRDVLAYARAKRVLRLQAIVLIGAVAIFYLAAALCRPQILTAFGWRS